MLLSLASSFRQFWAPPVAPPLPPEKVARVYPRYRWRALEASFIGYAAFYLVRNNLSTVSKELQVALHYDTKMIGNILAVSAISYGLAKFVMGVIGDRSDARKFMAAGLILTAACNFAFGASTTYAVHLMLWALNGFVQGMGWPPCGRVMGHWFSERERGLTFSIWNTSHNVGGGIAGVLAAWAVARYGGWQYAFYLPGVLALVAAAYVLMRLRDTPQAVGLPPIEVYRNDFPAGAEPLTESELVERERTLTTRELLFEKVLNNPWVWLLALANFFAYITRYSMLDWGPLYLRDIKGASLEGGGAAIMVLEFGGIPSTIFAGWLSDLAGGRRGMVAALCMMPIIAAFGAILVIPPGYLWLDMVMLCVIGFFVYPVINLITIAALDIVSKKAIGTAAGFIGLFGYIGRTVQAAGFGWAIDELSKSHSATFAWNVVLWTILGCAAAATFLLGLTWHVKPRA
jgi:OPA family glycerol-3-phosphate transporter-like MFS transporter